MKAEELRGCEDQIRKKADSKSNLNLIYNNYLHKANEEIKDKISKKTNTVDKLLQHYSNKSE